MTYAGAVRLEILQATGLSQVSPEQFPASDTTADLKITLRITTPETAPMSARFGMLVGTFATLSALAWGAKGKRP